MPNNNKLTKKDLQEIKLIYEQIADAIRIIEQETDKNSDKVNKLYSSIAKLNGQVVQYGQNFSLFSGLTTTSRDLTSSDMNLKIRDIETQLRKRRTKAEKELDRQNEAVANIFEDLIQTEIEKYTVSLGKSYDKAVKNAKTKKERKQLGTKEQYIDKWSKQFSSNFRKVAETTFDKELNFSENYGSPMTRSTAANIVVQAKSDAINNITDAQEEAAEKLKDAGTTLYEAGTILTTIGNKLLNLFIGGVEERSDIYEKTFQGIAVRTGITRNQYMGTQILAMPNELSNRGLFNNIEISEIQQSLADITAHGFKIDLSSEVSQAEAIGKSIDLIVTQKVVPYLDTNNENLLILSQNQPNFLKQIRGINNIAMNISENNIAGNKYLNDMINQLSPVSELAEEQLGVQFAQTIGIYDELINQGWNLKDISGFSNAVQDMINNPYSAVTSKDPYSTLAYAYLNQYGGDITNTADVAEAMLRTYGTYGEMFSGATGNAGALGVSSFAGGKYSTALKVSRNGLDSNSIINKINTYYNSENLDKTAEEVTKNLTNDMYNTVKQYQSITAKNLSVEMDGVKEQFGIVGDAIIDAIKGIGAILVTGYIGKLLKNSWGALIGNGKSGGILNNGAGGALGVTTSTIAITAATVALATTSLNKGVKNAEANVHDDIPDGLKDNSAYNKITGITEDIDNTQSGLGSYFKYIKGNLGQFGNNVLNTFSSDTTESNNRRYNNLVTAISGRGSNLSSKQRDEYLLAFMLLLASKNRLSDLGVTETELQTLVENENGPSVKNAVKLIGQSPLWNYQPHTNSGKIESLDQSWVNDTLSTWNYHRQGLATVPYDGYTAVLHAGETVLTASTTAALSSLVSEYRESRNSNYRIDAAIQEQTAQLVAKMDEVINAIGSRSLGNVNTNSPSEKLRNSLRTLTSPLAFQG